MDRPSTSDPRTLADALHGVGVTPVTPFTPDLSGIDRGGLRANLTFLIERGVRLIYPAGNTGEAASLSPTEWERVVEVSLDVADGRVAVVPGITHELPVALEMARRAAALGVDGLLLMPREQPYADGDGLLAYWSRIMDAAEVPVVLYKRGLPSDPQLGSFLDRQRVAGCKYGGKDIDGFASLAASHPGVTWTCGLAERYAPFYSLAGARGFTSGLGNVLPSLPLRMHAALRDGAWEDALALRSLAARFEGIRARHGDAYNVPVVKAAMDAIGLAGGPVRPPLRDVDAATRDEVATVVKTLTKEMA